MKSFTDGFLFACFLSKNTSIFFFSIESNALYSYLLTTLLPKTQVLSEKKSIGPLVYPISVLFHDNPLISPP